MKIVIINKNEGTALSFDSMFLQVGKNDSHIEYKYPEIRKQILEASQKSWDEWLDTLSDDSEEDDVKN